jgi:hypothetical protein
MLQVFFPSQVAASVWVAFTQAAALQIVPATQARQAPAPSQLPSSPQLAESSFAHWFKGSWLGGTIVQRPSLPATAQD